MTKIGFAACCVVVLSMSFAVACSDKSRGSAPVSTTTAPGQTNIGAGVTAQPAQQPPQWSKPEVAQALRGARQLLDSLPNDANDIAATARALGGDIEKQLAFVRDNFAFDPYPGCLRGAQGALTARAGNDIDRSLLLVAMLTASGHAARLVHGTLDTGTASRLLGHASQAPTVAPVHAMNIEEAAIQSGRTTSDLRGVLDTTAAMAKRISDEVDSRVQRHMDLVQQKLNEAGITISPSVVSVDSLRSHVWVQVQVGAEWKDLDSSFPEAVVGQSFAKPDGDAIRPEALPNDWFQRLRVRVTIHRQGAPTAEEVFDHELRVPNLLLSPLRMAFVPQDDPDSAKATVFQPTLSVGKDVIKGRRIELSSVAGGSDASGGLADAFGGDEEEVPQIQRVQLEISITAPGTATERATRTIAMSSPTVDPIKRLSDMRDQLVSVYEFFVTAGPVPLDWATRQQLLFLEQTRDPDPRKWAFVPVDLINLVRVMAAGDSRTGAMRRYYAQPLVVGQRVGFRREPDGRRQFLKSFDIWHNRVEFLKGDPLMAVRQGLFETELERQAAAGVEVLNTGAVFERFSGAVHVLHHGQEQTLAKLGLGADATARIAEDLGAGFVAIVPASSVQIGGHQVTGWWRIRPEGGETLGRMQSGEGQGMTEYAVTLLPAAYSLGANFYCGLINTQSGILCNPCLILGAGILGSGIALYGWAVGAGALSGLQYAFVMGTGVYGVITKSLQCVDWLTQSGIR